MAIVGHANHRTTASLTNAVAYTPVSAGNSLVATLYTGTTPGSLTVTDTVGNTWTTIVTPVGGGGGFLCAAYAKNILSGANTITCTIGNSLVSTVEVVECTGTGDFDTNSTVHTATSQAFSTNSATPAGANEIALAFVGVNGITTTSAWTNGYTLEDAYNANTPSLAVADNVVSAATSTAGAISGGANLSWAAIVLLFKPVSGGGGAYQFIQTANNAATTSVANVSVTGFNPNAGDSIIVLYQCTANNSQNGQPQSNSVSDGVNTYNYLGVTTDVLSGSNILTISSFTGGIGGGSQGATGLTLSATFAGSTGTYWLFFADTEVRQVTLTNGVATTSWTGGLANASIGTSVLINTNFIYVTCWQAVGVTGSNLTITGALQNGSHPQAIAVFEYSGIQQGGTNFNANFTWNNQIGSSGLVNSGNVNIVNAPAMLFGFAQDTQSAGTTYNTLGSGFVERSFGFWSSITASPIVADALIAANGNQAFTVTGSSTFDDYISMAFAFPLIGTVAITLLGQICL